MQQPVPVIERVVEKADSLSVSNSTFHFPVVTERELPKGTYTENRIEIDEKVYTPETHPLLFAVVRWLEDNVQYRTLSNRKMAAQFTADTGKDVSHVWTGIAKNYWIVNGG